MAKDALWVQASGTSYSALEDRQLLQSIFTAGVIDGLTLGNGGGLNVAVTAGHAAIADGADDMYIATLDSTTTKAITNNQTSTIYLVVDRVNGAVSLASGAAPSNPFLVIGSATAAGGVIASSTMSGRATADFRPTQNRDIRRVGDTLTGPIVLTSTGSISRSNSWTLDDSGIQAQEGIRIGSATNHTMRFYSRHYRTTAVNIPTGTTTHVSLDTTATFVNDYSPGSDPYGSASWVAPVNGYYHVSGRAMWQDMAGTDANGARQSLIRITDNGGSVTDRLIRCQFFQDSTLAGISSSASAWTNGSVTKNFLDQRGIWWEAGVDLLAGQRVYLDVYQSQGTTITVQAGVQSDASGAWGSIRLLQAD